MVLFASMRLYHKQISHSLFIGICCCASSTAAMAGVTSAGPPELDPILVQLDHPFQFFVYDSSQGLMLFEGRLGEPEVSESSAALEGYHSDEDFWSNTFGVDVTLPRTTSNYGGSASSTSGTASSEATTGATVPGLEGSTTTTTVATQPAATTTTKPATEPPPQGGAGSKYGFEAFLYAMGTFMAMMFI